MIKKLRKSLAYLFVAVLTLQASIVPIGDAQAGDNLLPDQIQNLKAKADTESVKLSWDVGEDADGYMIGYKIYYGTKSVAGGESEFYEAEIMSESTKTKYTVENLVAGTSYYFSITAVDDENGESKSYSEEVMVKPLAPQKEFALLSAEQTGEGQILVTMSDEVVLESELDAFVIENERTGEDVFIDKIETNLDTVLLYTSDARFKENQVYKVIASSSVVNTQGNPVSSGVTDETTFTSTSTQVKVVEPEIESVLSIETDVNTIPAAHSSAQEMGGVSGISNLIFDISALKKERVVILRWSQSGIDGISDQVLYVKKNNGAWDEGYSLGASLLELKLEVDLNTKYEVKVVTKDQNGKEGNGASVSFDTTLTKTGGSNVLAFVLAILAGGAYFVRRRLLT